MKCECGYEFAGPGEFRREQVFVTQEGESGIICPMCGTWYIHTGGRWCESTFSLVATRLRDRGCSG
jgi:hypothetical protein